MTIDPRAGKPAEQSMLTDIPALIKAYYTNTPDASVPEQRIAFGTSGHRGTSLNSSFNENHILAITQAICLYRAEKKIDGPLFIGFDTHALSMPAFSSAMEVLAANGVHTMIARDNEFTPTPVISHAILTYNKNRSDGFADGIIITPSHNPPTDGGFKYNPTNGGPAGTEITKWIEQKANELLQEKLKNVKRIDYETALRASTTHTHDYLNTYVNDLENIIDMKLLRESKINIGVDPLGGAGVHYWGPIAERYGLNLNVVSTVVDPTFSFMSVDWDGKIRMDPSSAYAMQKLIAMRERFDVAFACDTDHDRHGIVAKSSGLMNPNNYLSVAVFYLLQNRPLWPSAAAIGKTVVTTELISRITKKLNRKLYDVPVGFKWFSEGLVDTSLCFAAEESAGASFSRLDGSVWTTDKDGFVPALLAAEMTAKTGRDPGQLYKELTEQFGTPYYDRVEAAANAAQKDKLSKLSGEQIKSTTLAGEAIKEILTKAPANNAAIGGVKVTTENGWFAARPSGTEDIYKIYAESFVGEDHLKKILEEAQTIVDAAL